MASRFAPSLAVAVAATAGVLALTQTSGSTHEAQSAPGWLAGELGPSVPAEAGAFRRTPSKGVKVSVDQSGYTVVRERTSVAISSIGIAGGAWRDHANGRSRPTPFGRETITVHPTKTEQWLTVAERQGQKTWQWRLETNRKPTLTGSGSIIFGRGDQEILPVKILNARGGDVTPSGARWKLDRDGNAWTLALDLDDSELPLPYYIDPANQYITPMHLRSTQFGSFTGSGSLLTGNGAATTTTTVVTPSTAAAGTYQFNPRATNTTSATPSAAATDQLGFWSTANATSNTVIPAGDWTFTFTTKYTGADADGCGRLIVGMWTGNNGTGTFVPGTTVMNPTDSANRVGGGGCTNNDANDVLSSPGAFKTYTFTKTLPAVTLTNAVANRYLLVRLYVDVPTAPDATGNGSVQLNLDSPLPPCAGLDCASNQRIVHPGGPAVFSVAPNETTGGVSLDTSTEPDTLWYKSDAVGSFKLRVDAQDPTGITNVIFPTGFPANWTAAGSTVTSPEGGAGTVYESTNIYSWTAGAAGPGTKIISVRDNTDGGAGTEDFTTNHYLTIDADTTVPNGSASITANGSATASYNTSGTVALTKVDFTDAQSGMLSNNITRAFSTLSGGSCPAPSGSTAVTIVGGNDAAALAEGCYRYTLTGTDNVGNVATRQSAIVTVDTTVPTVSSVSSTTANGAYNAGVVIPVTVQFSEPVNVTGTPQLTLETGATDRTVNYTSGTGTDTLTFNYTVQAGDTSADLDYVATTPLTLNSGTIRDPATNNATLTLPSPSTAGSLGANKALVIDTTAPTGSITFPVNSTSYNPGTWTDAVTGTAGDAGSGVAAAQVSIQKDGGASACWNGTAAFDQVCPNWVTAPGATSWSRSLADSALPSGSYVVTLRATDNVGNVSGTLATSTFTFVSDVDPPTNAFSLDSATGASYPGTGTLIFYKGNRIGGGSFEIRTTVTDSGSGPKSATYGAYGGTSTGWSGHGSSEEITTPSGAYDSTAYIFAEGTTSAPTTAVFSTDNANNNSTPTTTFTLTNDVAPPSDGSVTFTGLGGTGTVYRTSLDIPIVLNNGSDAGSGINASTEVLDRLEAPLSSGGTVNGTCGGFVADGSFTPLTNPSLSFTDAVSIESGKCYRYTYTVTDNVGNAVIYTSADVKIDTSAPVTPLTVAEVASDADSHVSATTLFYRPGGGRSGSFTVDAAATDSDSGIEKVNFPAVGTGVSRTAPGGAGDDTAPTPYQGSYDWADTASAAGAQTVTATNNASGTGTATFTLTADSAPPSGGSATFTGLVGTGSAYRNVASIPVVLANGSDSGSGINGTTESLQRQVADLTSAGIADGGCGTFANDGAATVDPALSFTDATGIVTGKCYRYLYTVTDNVGNAAVYTSADVKVDTSAPAAPAQLLTENPADPDQHATGSTVFFRPGTDGGSFRVTSTATDAQSGIKQVSSPSITNVSGGGANDPTSPYEADYTWSVSTLAGDGGDKNVTATNNADGTSVAGTFAFTPDSAASSGGSVTFTGLVGTGTTYRTTAEIPVVLANGTDGAGSGINESTESLQRLEAPLTSAGSTANGVCGTFVADTSFTALTNPSLSFTDTVSIESGKCYRYTYTVADNVGITTTYTSADVKVDTSVPATPVLTASDGGDADSHVAGSIFLRTDATPSASNGGTFTVEAATTDAESGLEKVGFPSLSGSSISGGGDDALPAPYSGTYTWTTSSTAVASATVTATNNASGAASSLFAVAIDNTDPTGSVSYYDGLSSIGTATVSFTNADGGSGLASVTIKRDSASITGATCGTFPGTYATLVATNPGASPLSDTLPGFGCYRYRIELTDNVGNTATSAPTFVYRYGAAGPLEVVEDSNPGKQHLAGQTLFVGDGGTFRISVPTGALPPGSTIDFPGASATGLTGTAKPDDTAPFESNTYTFTGSFAGSTPLAVVLKAAGDGSSTETLTVTRDSTAPTTTDNTGSLPAPEPSGWYLTSQTVTLSPSDGGSGVSATHYTTNGTTPTTGSTSGTSIVLGDGQHTIKYFSVDNVGNEAGVSTAGATVKIDSTQPANSISRVAVSGNSFLSGTNVYYRGIAAGSFQLSNAVSDATSGPAESAYPVLGGTTTGWTHSGETITTPAGGPYASTSPFAWTAGTSSSPTLTVTSKDVAGQSKATTLTFVNDSTAPAGGAIVANGSSSDSYNNTGTAAISLTAFTDAGSGVASTTITRASATLTGTTCGSFSGADPVTLSGGNDAATLAGGACYRYSYTATDNLGQSSSTVTSAAVKVDTTAPTATIDSGPAGTVSSSSATFTFSSTDTTASFQCRRDGGTYEACLSPATFTGFSAGAHTVDVRAIDPAGNIGPTSSHSWTVASSGPNTAPALSSSTPDDGATVSSVNSISLTATESVTWSSITVKLDANAATSHTCSGSQTATTCTFNYVSSTAGPYTVQATINDGTTSVVIETHFTIWSGTAGSDAPAVEFNAGGSSDAEATASNGTATVTVPGGATSDSIVVRIDPKPSTATGGFSVGTDTVEVTATRTSNGTSVSDFAKPLDVHFANAATDLVPLYSQDGSNWVALSPTSGHALPAGRADAYFRDSSNKVHILTTHLTFFTLARDVAAPAASRSLVGVVAGDGLTLRWEPAADNVGVTNYVLLIDGVFAQLFGGQTYEAKLGAFTAGDTRTFSIQGRDAAGLYGPATATYRGVPSLTGLTLEQATAALAARGFRLGSVSGSGGTILAQAPTAPGLAAIGSAVNVTAGAAEGGQAKLVLRVASAKRISLATRGWMAVRVTVSAPSQVTGELVDSRNRTVKRYAAKNVPSGSSTVRFALPTVRQAGTYKLHVRATASGQRVARTARVQLVPGVPKARFTPVRRPIGVVVIDGSIKGLNLGSSFRVNYVVPSLAFDVVGLQPAFIEAAVIDLAAVDKSFVRNLRQVFPELKILVLAPTSAAAAQARAGGASIALVKPVPASRVAALLRRTLGR